MIIIKLNSHYLQKKLIVLNSIKLRHSAFPVFHLIGEKQERIKGYQKGIKEPQFLIKFKYDIKNHQRKRVFSMTSLIDCTLNFNKNMKISFNGENLSSDAGLLIPRSFDEKLGLSQLIN